MDVLAFELTIANQIESRREAREATPDDIGALFVGPFGLLRVSERFVIAS